METTRKIFQSLALFAATQITTGPSIFAQESQVQPENAANAPESIAARLNEDDLGIFLRLSHEWQAGLACMRQSGLTAFVQDFCANPALRPTYPLTELSQKLQEQIDAHERSLRQMLEAGKPETLPPLERELLWDIERQKKICAAESAFFRVNTEAANAITKGIDAMQSPPPVIAAKPFEWKDLDRGQLQLLAANPIFPSNLVPLSTDDSAFRGRFGWIHTQIEQLKLEGAPMDAEIVELESLFARAQLLRGRILAALNEKMKQKKESDLTGEARRLLERASAERYAAPGNSEPVARNSAEFYASLGFQPASATQVVYLARKENSAAFDSVPARELTLADARQLLGDSGNSGLISSARARAIFERAKEIQFGSPDQQKRLAQALLEPAHSKEALEITRSLQRLQTAVADRHQKQFPEYKKTTTTANGSCEESERLATSNAAAAMVAVDAYANADGIKLAEAAYAKTHAGMTAKVIPRTKLSNDSKALLAARMQMLQMHWPSVNRAGFTEAVSDRRAAYAALEKSHPEWSPMQLEAAIAGNERHICKDEHKAYRGLSAHAAVNAYYVDERNPDGHRIRVLPGFLNTSAMENHPYLLEVVLAHEMGHALDPNISTPAIQRQWSAKSRIQINKTYRCLSKISPQGNRASEDFADLFAAEYTAVRLQEETQTPEFPLKKIQHLQDLIGSACETPETRASTHSSGLARANAALSHPGVMMHYVPFFPESGTPGNMPDPRRNCAQFLLQPWGDPNPQEGR